MEVTQKSEEKLWSFSFVTLILSTFMLFLGFQMLLPTLPVYVKDHGGDSTSVGLVIGMFTITALIIRPFAGSAADRMGRKPILFIGLIITILSISSYIFAITVFLLLMLRLIHGLGWGMSTTIYGTIASDIIPKSRRGEGMGYFGLSISIAMMLGPLLGIWLMNTYGFLILFVLASLFSLGSLLLSNFSAPDKQKDNRGSTHKPFLSSLFDRNALFPSLLMLIIAITYGGIVSFITLFAEEKQIDHVGWFFFTNALCLIIIRPIAGKVFDRRGEFLVLFPGGVLGIAALYYISFTDSTIDLIISAILYGFSFGLIQPSLQAWTINRASPEKRGAANGTFFSAYDSGIGIGAILLGAYANVTSYSSMFKLSAFTFVLYLLVYGLYLWKAKRNKESNSHPIERTTPY
ncbi:MFS transporter [Halobacillus naozhouensis]|uniref:MFS transporter n=1 Tax=Halobacillus naozhouensis TaxID=554880 RepID=A0ABY8IVN8_9BACI|nr:MFS transporter [Halobacillus naozhouensis]WFT74265.1 MFS transporter [Halobacillus naozhouensis]